MGGIRDQLKLRKFVNGLSVDVTTYIPMSTRCRWVYPWIRSGRRKTWAIPLWIERLWGNPRIYERSFNFRFIPLDRFMNTAMSTQCRWVYPWT